MSRPDYEVKEQWLGTGDTLAYTFNFKIEVAAILLLIAYDGNGLEQWRVRGDDITQLASCIFDPVNGGGTITLLNFFPDTWSMTLLLAPDQPIQPDEYKGKTGFSLSAFEQTFDRLSGQIQRLAYLCFRSVKLDDGDDAYTFDADLPPGATNPNNAGATLAVNPTNTGWQWGATLSQIAQAATFAANALASANAAATSAANALASAIAAAASAAGAASGYTVTGTRSIPLGITAAGGIAFNTGQRQFQFIHGSPGPVTISANPQIGNGLIVGQEMVLMCCDDTNSVTFTNGDGLLLNGNFTMLDGDTLSLIWDGNHWSETSRREG